MTDLKDFYVELFKYYMEFLQTDFKSQRGPNRLVTFENKKGLLCDIDLSTYPKVSPLILKLLQSNFAKNSFGTVKKNSYVVHLTQSLINLVIEKFQLNRDIEQAIGVVKKELHKQSITLKEDFLEGFKEKDSIEINDLRSYLNEYVAYSLYGDLFDMWKNKLQSENEEFYLYFFDIRYKGKIYPLFYLQVSVERTVDGDFEFEFSPTLLINKKAVEFVLSKYSKELDKNVRIPLFPTRQIYLSDFQEEGGLNQHLQNSLLIDLCNTLGLPIFNIQSLEPFKISNESVQLTNTCYFSLADKSDEALLNDYEELHHIVTNSENNEAFKIFEKIGNDFLFNNPESFESVIEEEFNSLSLDEKLSYLSPIPLNKEQLMILKAIEKEECNRIIVEGPPGTGKSHTIVSIIFNALLNKKSVLVVSDTKEALDVVENKINDVLEKIELNERMENPILRLGKRENNINNIFSQMNFDKIKNRNSSYKSLGNQTENEISGIISKIKNNINEEIKIQKSISPEKILRLLTYEKHFINEWMNFIDIDEVKDSSESIKELWESIQEADQAYKFLSDRYQFVLQDENMSFNETLNLIRKLQEDVKSIQLKIKQENFKLYFSKDINNKNVTVLADTLEQLELLKLPLINTYWFKGRKIKQLERNLQEIFFNCTVPSIKKNQVSIEKELAIYKRCIQLENIWAKNQIDFFALLRDEEQIEFLDLVHRLGEALKRLVNVSLKIPLSFAALGLDIKHTKMIFASKLRHQKEEDILNLIEYVDIYFNTLEGSGKSISSSYNEERNFLQNRLIFKMTNTLDQSVVLFRESFKNDSEEIRRRVKAKQKLSKSSLAKLVDAFPCLIVGVRELGEFLPLAPNLFDIVIIDEASQVSIAQAFPAIIRGKKVVVLGDPKQYANFKSSNVDGEINNVLFNQVKDEFTKSIVNFDLEDSSTLTFKVNGFNVKNSILDFIRNISNHQSALKKHFRGYMELIGYSNKNFYKESLQVMKIRGLDLHEVIKFHVIKDISEKENKKNINISEANFILDEVTKLKNVGFKGTVGIITPFAHQHKYLTDLFYSNENQTYFNENFQLKLMTFDSCQGEERDIIFYSMVERENEDILKRIFLLQFGNLDNDELNSRNATRLNVGFSRAKESVRFVLSKEPEDIRGEMGNALKYFRNILEQPVVNEAHVDGSKDVLLDYIKKTSFYNARKDEIELVPNFDVHQYIKQLDNRAIKQKFKSYVLMKIKNELSKPKIAIIEYDCFDENSLFPMQEDIIFDAHYIEKDIEKRKTIESYGYPFFRVNKFLMDTDPEGGMLNKCFEASLIKK
ncbi:AAA domain-containing protein [Paenibacillus sp. FSL R7-0198]|uniref:AAA domain-containing protein n=1 Tax=Paenibacillus sp. FSL R7-0198 TaxID=2921674 RepID=UPI0030F85B1E